jgi:hypothetical protein
MQHARMRVVADQKESPARPKALRGFLHLVCKRPLAFKDNRYI